MQSNDNDIVYISAERLKELQELERKLPSLIEDAVKDYKKSNLEKLHARDKANPAAVNARVKRYAEKHREEINRRLREKRQAEKQKRLASSASPILTSTPAPTNDIVPMRPLHIIRPAKPTTESTPPSAPETTGREEETPIPHPYPTVKTNVTVRFDS